MFVISAALAWKRNHISFKQIASRWTECQREAFLHRKNRHHSSPARLAVSRTLWHSSDYFPYAKERLKRRLCNQVSDICMAGDCVPGFLHLNLWTLRMRFWGRAMAKTVCFLSGEKGKFTHISSPLECKSLKKKSFLVPYSCLSLSYSYWDTENWICSRD